MFSDLCSRISRCGIVNHMVKFLVFPDKMGITNRRNTYEPGPGQIARPTIAAAAAGTRTIPTQTRCACGHARLIDCAARAWKILGSPSSQAINAGGSTEPIPCRHLCSRRVLCPRGTTIVRYVSESQVPRAISQDPKSTGPVLSGPYWYRSRYGYRQRGAGA